jgi:putative phosphoesterase
MQTALGRQRRAPDGVLYLGDGLADTDRLSFGYSQLFAVRGNCDLYWDPSIKTEELLAFEGHRILITHGHLYGVKSGTGALIAHAAECGADVVLFGHTHKPICTVIPADKVPLGRPMYLFNPGSIGQSGSFGTLTLRGDNVLLSHGSV